MKYLISCAHDGTINFISQGYGGRASDMSVFKDYGILEKLPKNSTIRADFKVLHKLKFC